MRVATVRVATVRGATVLVDTVLVDGVKGSVVGHLAARLGIEGAAIENDRRLLSKASDLGHPRFEL